MAANPSPPTYKQQDALPTRKVTVAGVAGALTTIIVWVVNTWVIVDPTKVITGEIGAAIATVLSFGIGYLVPPSKSDQIVPS